ncbi:MAG: MotA/TolQ/ExbB proton channel family protein [Verrucomicrobiae bacterium]|nr:MotA/TolQ/ExbB proton channel family protein [Verrucomicrobiae bacterium]
MSSIWQFLVSGGLFMFFIVLCSFVSVGVIVFKALDLREKSVMPESLVDVLTHPEVGAAHLRQAMTEGDSTLARISRTLLASRAETRDDASQSVQAAAREEVIHLERGIAVLEVIITIAPLLGLLGTVSGLVSVFGLLGNSGGEAPNPTQLALGISEALNTTIAGLAVAIYTVVAHSYFNKKVERFAARMESVLGKALATLFPSAAL